MFIILFTIGLILFIFLFSTFVFSWELGKDFIIKGNFGRRLNPFEKLFDGFNRLLKL